MKILRHIFAQPFITATGVAALVHSTWALGTLFSGEQPAGGWELAGWLVPAFLIAFALDVGQIVTSAEIRSRGLTWQRAVTFTVFAAATYYLQWLYIAHHMPALDLAGGVRGEWTGFTTLVRDAALWLIPALLPLSTLLYTLSSNQRENQPASAESAAISEPVLVQSELLKPITKPDDRRELPAVTPDDESEWLNDLVNSHESAFDDYFIQQKRAAAVAAESETHTARCEACGWEKEYSSAASAARGYGGHMKHCPAVKPEVVSNGVHSAQDEAGETTR